MGQSTWGGGDSNSDGDSDSDSNGDDGGDSDSNGDDGGDSDDIDIDEIMNQSDCSVVS